jgi:hypothetical protein
MLSLDLLVMEAEAVAKLVVRHLQLGVLEVQEFQEVEVVYH